MSSSPISKVVDRLRRSLGDGAESADARLLGDYVRRRDGAAFAELVRRHGPMVWGVCRRVLGNDHDAADAFQATFLVLVRKAASIASRELLANWLYGVAHQTALKARAVAIKRKGRERQVTEMPEPAVRQPDPWRDLQPVLDEELSRLPDRYRGVLVLCDLEGKTRKEAAAQLGCPEGTVASRLVRARTMLARRLTRRGIALSGGALATVLARNVAPACVPDVVVSSTIRAAGSSTVVSPPVAALTEGVLKAMMMKKLQAAVAVAVVAGVLGTGAMVLGGRTALAQPPAAPGPPPVAEKPAPAAPSKAEKVRNGEKLPEAVEGQLKWGEAVNGLRAALAIRTPPGKAAELPDIYLVLQNVSKAAVRLSDANVPANVNLRVLYLRIDGQIKWGLGAREPSLSEVLLQPREVAYLPLFDPDKKLSVPADPTLDRHTVGSHIAEGALKDARQTLFAQLEIEKAPAGAWTGKLVAGETTGAAALIKSDTRPAGKK